MRNGVPDFVLSAPARLRLAAAVDPEAGADADGRFSCVASIFEQRIPRVYYDMILRDGCFNDSLAERGLPSLVWSHDWQLPPLGVTERCEQVDLQLEADGRLFVADGEDHQRAREVHLAMSARNADGRAPLREFSLGFDVTEARWDIVDDDEIFAVYRAELYEFGPCLVGAVAGTGMLRAPDADELLQRFPRPSRGRLAAGDPDANLELAHALAHLGRA